MGVTEASDRAWKVVQMKSEKQGVSAWLRGIIGEYEANGARSCSGMAEMLGIECEYETCQSCMVKMMTTIADRIDAERALPDGMEWPRFEDGGLVKVGDEVEFMDETMSVYSVTFGEADWSLWCACEGIDGRLSGSCGERVKRPAPKVLDADGVPIKVGDTVYFIADKDDGALTVECIDVSGEKPVVDLVYSDERGTWHLVDHEKLTHERPDSWRLWGEDLDRAVKVGEVDKVEMMRRAKALAKGECE